MSDSPAAPSVPSAPAQDASTVSAPTTITTPAEPTSTSTSEALAQGTRFLALRKWNEACDHLATAVEQATEQNGELDPRNVDALMLYGKALLGSAIAQSAVLGGGAPTNETDGNGAASPSSAIASAPAGPSNAAFSFGGDAEDEEEEEGGEGEDGEGEDGAAGGDREDDLESAFQVLEIARTILEKELENASEGKGKGKGKETATGGEEKTFEGGDEKVKERLAEIHRLLGDVESESERFDGAVTEYLSSLTLLSSFLPPHDRSLSELHMLIALALDFVPEATARAVSHAQKAKDVLLLKVAELEKQLEGGAEGEKEKAKREIEDIKGLMGDVDMKIEDLRTVPVAPVASASDQALQDLLRDSMSAAATAISGGQVNDLTGLVKKKKKPVVQAVQAAPEKVGEVAEKIEEAVKEEASAASHLASGSGEKRKQEESDGSEAKKQKTD